MRFVFTALVLIFVLSFGTPAHADNAAIQAQIEAIAKQKAVLDAEIAKYQKELEALAGTHQTLQSAISTIDVSRTKTSTQIQSIQKKIAGANLQLSQLSDQISSTETVIAVDRASVASSLRDIARNDENSIIESVLAAASLADAWRASDALVSVNSALRGHVEALSMVKTQLADQHDAVSSTKTQLSSSNKELSTQKAALDAQKAAKNQLLTQTKSQEASYQTLIAQKRAEEQKFEAALFQLASQLQSANSALAPPPHKGVLAWPLKEFVITQAFGKTSDSGRLYASGTHDGIDLKASVGTPVYSALSGTVMQINEGAVQNCQYGKWVVIKHANGLATLYAHLSQINVKAGQSLSTGEVIGYAGMTGYATGPHLHFTVYNGSAVTFKSYTCKSGYTVTIPIAPPNAYLDPQSYL